ncbi:MAG: peroxiredoxin [Gammaproteobacteria bacterium]|nr:peroxiredoxin [Gammaproteobacteria bacterium]
MASAKRSRTRVKTKTPKAGSRTKPRTVSRSASAKSLPRIEIQTTGGKRLRLSDLKGKRVVLYFYPRDDTPGCTREGCDIRDRHGEFTRRNAVVLGVSRDGLATHEKFKSKYGFPFELVSDPDEKLCRAFDVIQEKSLYGRKVLGVERSTFVFDETGKLRRAFRGVKVDGHAQQILDELDKL